MTDAIRRAARPRFLSIIWPPPGISRATAEAHFRAGIEAWDQVDRALMPERRANLFVKHPRMGDLTIEEWMRFHMIHARHHAPQIRERVTGE